MSVRALSWSFSLPLQDMAAKGVLHALADHADEDWKCWPSLSRIALFVGCSENTARRALQRVEAMGIVQRVARPGQSDMFFLNQDWAPSQIGTPAKAAPPPSERLPLPTWDLTPPNVGGDPSQGGTRTTIEPSRTKKITVKSAKRSSDERLGTRLPADFELTPDRRAIAEAEGQPPERTFAIFCDYWRSASGASAKKLDWDATWRNWCRRAADNRRTPARGGAGIRPSAIRDESSAFARAADILAGR